MSMNEQLFNIGRIKNYKNMPDLIAEALKDSILHGQIKGGVQLKQDEIAKQFDVSLIPVREALIQLEGEKLVTCIRNKGALVTRLSFKEMSQLFELRKILEAGSMGVCQENVSEDCLSKLRFLLIKMEKEEDMFALSRHNRLFHELLCECSANPLLGDVYKNMFVRVERYLMYGYYLVPDRQTQLEEHSEILSLLEKGENEEVAKRLSEHIDKEQEKLVRYLERGYDLNTLDWNIFLPFKENIATDY